MKINNQYFGLKAMTKGAKLLEKEVINKDTGGQKEPFLEFLTCKEIQILQEIQA